MFFKNRSGKRLVKTLDYKIIAFNLILFLLIVYFSFHSLNGDRGLFAYFRLKTELAQQTKVLATLQNERGQLEEKARLLHPKTLDPDMLDEIARREFSMIAPDEKVIILGKPKK